MIPACSHALESFAPCYVVMLGVYGLFFSLFNKWDDCKEILPEHYLRRRPLNTWMAAGFYFCLLAGVVTNTPAYYAPFLLVNALILVLILIKTLIRRTAVEGLVIPSKIVTFILIFNWLSVAWAFGRAVYCNDWLGPTIIERSEPAVIKTLAEKAIVPKIKAYCFRYSWYNI